MLQIQLNVDLIDPPLDGGQLTCQSLSMLIYNSRTIYNYLANQRKRCAALEISLRSEIIFQPSGLGRSIIAILIRST